METIYDLSYSDKTASIEELQARALDASRELLALQKRNLPRTRHEYRTALHKLWKSEYALKLARKRDFNRCPITETVDKIG